MTYAVSGACHCKNLSFELFTQTSPRDIRARACDCRFCQIHAAKNWSDPDGSVTIRIADEQYLKKYRFGLRTADFYICRRCGTYLGAVLSDDEGTWSTVNLRLTELTGSEEAASYGAEDRIGRIKRRKCVWTPTAVITGAWQETRAPHADASEPNRSASSKQMSSTLPAEIETPRLFLRPYRFEDVEDVLGYASNEEWARYLEAVPHPYTKADAVAFIARQVLLDRQAHATWALVFEDTVVGGISIRFSFGHSVGEMGWLIARKLWNRGLMTEAASVVMNVAFSTYPSLRRIRAMADARNTASHRVMAKIGMTSEGTLRQNRLVSGALIDEVWFGILRSEQHLPHCRNEAFSSKQGRT